MSSERHVLLNEQEYRQETIQWLLDEARRRGVAEADVILFCMDRQSVQTRERQTERVQRENTQKLGLRVLKGGSTAVVSTTELERGLLGRLLDQAIELAGATRRDPLRRIPPRDDHSAPSAAELDLYDPAIAAFTAQEAIERTMAMDAAARAADRRITSVETARLDWTVQSIDYGSSNGFLDGVTRTRINSYVMPVGAEGRAKERDWASTDSRSLKGLDAPEDLVELAVTRTLRRLGAKRPRSCVVPVIYEHRIAGRLLGSLVQALQGNSIYRGLSWLGTDNLGKVIASPAVTIRDDPSLPRGLASLPFDMEGQSSQPLPIISGGRLENLLLDDYSSRKLKLTNTMRASRSAEFNPMPYATNFKMEQGAGTLDDLISDVKEGVFLTELIGMGENSTTGDYSQGATGIWIEKGKLTQAVNEFTVASTLQEIWLGIDGLANDRSDQAAISAPSLRVSSMTVAGA